MSTTKPARPQWYRRARPGASGLVIVAVAAAGCGSSGGAHSASAGSAAPNATSASPAPTAAATATTATTVAPTTTPTTAPPTAPPPTTVPPTTVPPTIAASTTAAPTTTGPPPFTSSVSPVSAAELGATWHAGCPVGPSSLRDIRLTYWGFDGAPHTGNIVVAASVAAPVTEVFSTLYRDRFPLREVVPESAYGGNDNTAAAADDTSGFNCRYAVAPGTPSWSVHAFGEAIDVNDVENPYFEGSAVIPPAGAAYANRAAPRPGMAVPGGALVSAFATVGWQWGGRWSGSPDYQHFSATGG